MNKDKVKNIVIIVESAFLGLVASLFVAGSVNSCSKTDNVTIASKMPNNKRLDDSHFMNITDEDAYNSYFAPITKIDGVFSNLYHMIGLGDTNVLDSTMDFTFTGSFQIGVKTDYNTTSNTYFTLNDTTMRVYYDSSVTPYGGVRFVDLNNGHDYLSYLPIASASDYNSHVPLLWFLDTPVPSDYWYFIKNFYSYWSCFVSEQPSTYYVKPYVTVDWLNLYPSVNEAFIVGFQNLSSSSYFRVIANFDNLKVYGKTSSYYTSSADLVDLGDLYFDYDGNLCYLPTTGAQWNIYYYSSQYFYDWFRENTFTSEEWNNGLYYLDGDMNLYTKYLYEDISNSSATSGEVMALDNLRFRIYRKNLLSMSTLIDKFGINVTTLSSGDKKYTLNAWGDGSRISWADNTDSGDYVISFDDGSTFLNFKYGLSNRIHWDNAIITCQESYIICKYFAPYYSTALVNDEVTTDGSSLTNSSFNNVFLLLGNAFTLCFGWLNVEVFPGITLFGLLLVPFVVLLIIVVFRLVKK